MPLTDAQLVLLSAASQRDDGFLPRPDKLAGAALFRTEAALVTAGLAEPASVRGDQPRWRVGEAETPIGLHITPAGLKAIGIDTDAAADATAPDHPASDSISQADLAHPDMRAPGEQTGGSPARSFRAGTKLAQLVALLSQAESAGIDALTTALSWQPHTVRAAITRLRRDGIAVVTGKDAQNRATYRIDATKEVGAARADAPADPPTIDNAGVDATAE